MAMLVLALGILAMAPMMVLSITANQFSREATTIAAAAQEQIEEKIGQGSFASVPYVEQETLGNGKYEVLTVVVDDSVDPAVPRNVYQINVTVNWEDDADVNRTMTFSTLVSKP